jgi:hypothetical protein
MLRGMVGYFRRNVVGFLALFVALGGTGAYAANTVFSSDIVNGEVKSIDIADNAVESADVKDGSISTFDVHTLLGADVVDNTLTGADIQESSLGQVPSAVNSDKLGGTASTDYVRGAGTERRFGFVADTSTLLFQFVVPGGRLDLDCNDTAGQHPFYRYVNQSGGTLDIWRLRESTGTLEFFQLGVNQAPGNPIFSDTPERWTYEISNADGTFIGEVDVWMAWDGTKCHFAVHTGASSH